MHTPVDKQATTGTHAFTANTPLGQPPNYSTQQLLPLSMPAPGLFTTACFKPTNHTYVLNKGSWGTMTRWIGALEWWHVLVYNR